MSKPQMNKGKYGTAPKLRFPEFRDNGPWEERPLISIAKEKLTNGVFNDLRIE